MYVSNVMDKVCFCFFVSVKYIFLFFGLNCFIYLVIDLFNWLKFFVVKILEYFFGLL